MVPRSKIVFFDGMCNLCNAAVNFIWKRNLKRNLFYTSLQSEFAKNQLLEENSNNQNINTIYFLDNGVLYKKSLAVYRILKELDGVYSYFSILRFIIPIPLSDFIIISSNLDGANVFSDEALMYGMDRNSKRPFVIPAAPQYKPG